MILMEMVPMVVVAVMSLGMFGSMMMHVPVMADIKVPLKMRVDPAKKLGKV